ncbi:hypothetical protein RND81_03G135100 [Saponaria officinalis]|uniref:KIB1-4 beta-propeller domain-containing protein n=1 Tax=Saponaria officinalis TaxID=3572 RepID=A0AAW1M003_SAPOF
MEGVLSNIQTSAAMAVDWSSLPVDLVCTIALNLKTFEDFIYFSAVCRSWNHASSLIKHQWRATPVVPWLLLAQNTNEDQKSIRDIFNLKNNKCYKFNFPEMVEARCWGSVDGWVAMVDHHLDVQLFNPITKARIRFPSVIPLCLYEDNEIHYFYGYEVYVGWMLSFFLQKFIVLKISPDEFLIVLLYDWQGLAFVRYGDPSWTNVVTPNSVGDRIDNIDATKAIVDVASVNDDVFALYNTGTIVYWNVKEFGGCGLLKLVNYFPPSQPLIFFDKLMLGMYRKYLVKSGNQLLVVLQSKEEVLNAEQDDYDYDFFYRTTGFQVYKLNFTDRKWEEIQDFGDVALIVGNNSSMCVPIASSKSMHRSCIYFTDDEYNMSGSLEEKSGHDIGAYDIKCRQIWKFYEGGNTRSLRCPPTCFIPQF